MTFFVLTLMLPAIPANSFGHTCVELGVPIPDITDSRMGTWGWNETVNAICSAVGLGTFVRIIANILMVITIMTGLIVIVWGGYIYMTAAGDGSRIQSAKAWIVAGLSGILLAVLAYFILNLIGGESFTDPLRDFSNEQFKEGSNF